MTQERVEEKIDGIAEMSENVSAAPESAQIVESAEPRQKKPRKKMSKKKKIVLAIVVVVIALAVFGMVKLLTGGKAKTEVVTDIVQYGSITSKVEGTGMTRAKDSATITVTTTGKVQDVYVQAGEYVEKGTPLYVIDSDAAKAAVQTAKKNVDGYQKQLDSLNKDLAGLNLKAPYKGKLTDVATLKVGDSISKGTKIATLIDDGKMRLTQYYSYAYKSDISVGQGATISIPSLMSQVNGKVEKINMVSRISAEGSKLFEVIFIMDNPGTLTADMQASATITTSSLTIYPYEAGKLENNRKTDIMTKVDGTIKSVNLINYLEVSEGTTVLLTDGADSQNDIFTLEQNLKTAQKDLETAQKNYDNMNAVAPISGTVLAIGIAAGDEIAAGTTTISIANTAAMLIDANIDERNISFVKAGMSVDIDQWGTMFTGTVDSVSLTGKTENGVSKFPAVVSVANPDGTMMTGSSVTYSLIASENNNCLVLPIQCVKYVQLEDGTTGTVVFVKGSRPDNAIELTVPLDGVPEDFWAVPVEIGISDNYNVEIKSGVEENTEVFTQATTTNGSNW